MTTNHTFLSQQRLRRTSSELLIVFDDTLSNEERDAVTLTTWAAESSARQTVGALVKNPEAWITVFQRVLTNLGWIPSDQSYETSQGRTTRMRSRADKIVRAKMGPGNATEDLLSALTKAENWPERPRCVGIVHDQDSNPAMQLLVLLTSLPKGDPRSRENASEAQTVEYTVKYWRAQLNWSFFENIESKLLDKMGEGMREQRRPDPLRP